MAKYTKYLEFSTKERVAIKERDNYQCIFCQIGYKMPPAAGYRLSTGQEKRPRRLSQNAS